MSSTASLTWYADRGFELDLTADLEDIQLRFAGVPVPADGTIELENGVELNKIDILFKCQAAIDGAPAQLRDATVVVKRGTLVLEAGLEDVENGLLYPIESEIPCVIPSGIPASGGPRNESPDEDDLDWGDETTFEAIAGDVPDVALLTEEIDKEEDEEEKDAPPAGALAKLLEALKRVDEVTETAPMPPLPDDEPFVAPVEPSDQKMSQLGEAIGFLDLLLRREDLELEEGHDVAELGQGTAEILRMRVGPEGMAHELSEWLLDQPAVADLYITDETLAELLEQW